MEVEKGEEAITDSALDDVQRIVEMGDNSRINNPPAHH